MKYLVLGAGADAMGTAIAARLLKEKNSQVYIADQNTENVDKTFAKLILLPKGEGSDLRFILPGCNGLDVVKQKNQLPMLFKNFDIVISAIPASMNTIIAEAVILANETRPFWGKNNLTHYLDLGGVLEITKKIIHWDTARRAEACGISVVTDGGFGPGLDDSVSMHLIRQFDDSEPLESLIIEIGVLPYNYSVPPFYTKLFNLKGVEEMYYNPPLVLCGGKLKKIPPLPICKQISAREFDLFFETPEIVMFEPAITDGLCAMPYFLEGRVLKYQERTLRYPGHFAWANKTPRKDFIPAFEKMLAEYPVEKDNIAILRVTAIGKSAETLRRTKIESLMHVRSDKNFNSMQKPTGFTAALMAKLIAEGKARRGAYPAGIALDPEDVLDAVKKDFYIYERTTPLK
ncbi:MAG: saccharopine dehydrogenase C-terminal domain-containing protein [bacterium]|nr:saccharopine dehydrogenase C-terminal domain-containing protein [bacterium]